MFVPLGQEDGIVLDDLAPWSLYVCVVCQFEVEDETLGCLCRSSVVFLICKLSLVYNST